MREKEADQGIQLSNSRKGWTRKSMRKLSKKSLCVSLVSLCLATGSALSAAQAEAQAGKADHGSKSSSNTVNKKEITFEVISIRPVKPGYSPYDPSPAPLSNTEPSPDGFFSTLTVWQMLMIAYSPVDQSAWNSIPLINEPKWFHNIPADWYVINARVSPVDIGAWRNQSIHHELLRSAMQDLLKKRCKLVIHEQPAERPDYKLVIAPKGLKMKVTPPGAVLPKNGSPLRTGGVRIGESIGQRTAWHYYGATMQELISFLGDCSPDRPIRDGTGLSGRYDFTIRMIDNPSNDRHDQLHNWPLAPLGLELKPGKYSGFKLVIDHMEKPTPNS